MRSPFKTPFGAVFQNEVLVNSKRVAPYVLMILFTAHSILWWGWSAAATYGWGTNSDYNIFRNLQGFSFILGLPIFNAVLMGDPVIKDFQERVDPLIFSKPLSRAAYLLGKFFGNFFVLVCCQATFVLTMLLMQWFPWSRVVVLPTRVFPYFKHFLFFVVISHFVLAAFYFTVGTLTRNAKIVYGLAVSFYPFYIAHQVFLLQSLPQRWGIVLDPFLLNSHQIPRAKWEDADWINQIVVSYSLDMIANRAFVILIAGVCLTILCVRFAKAERPTNQRQLSIMNLSTAAEGVYYDPGTFQGTRSQRSEKPDTTEKLLPIILLPGVSRTSKGFRANLNKLIAALGIEFHLLRAERSLVVILPLAIFLSTLELAFYDVVPVVSYSAAYSSSTAKALLLFLLAITVFYTGEAMHRDREVRIEPVLWVAPAPNNVLLLSKLLSTLLLALFLVALVGLTAIVIQLIRGHRPVEVSAYLRVYSVILIPSIALMAGTSLALSVLLRDKYLAYAVAVATGAGLFYLYSQGYNHWLYNPVLYQLWTYSDLAGAESNTGRILTHRVYCLALASLGVALAHLWFPRKSLLKSLRSTGRLGYSGWALIVAALSVAVAVITGLMIILSPR